MFRFARPLFLIVETPLHAGSGTDLGIVDLPIQREKHTDYPKVEASGLKGSIREVFETQPNVSALERAWPMTFRSDAYLEAIRLVFGPEAGADHASASGFTDARLLLFPVKSVAGVFAWVTCPAILERFRNDLSMCHPSVTFQDQSPQSTQTQ